MLLLNGVLGPRSWTEPQWWYWFIEALVYTLLALTLVPASPSVRRGRMGDVVEIAESGASQFAPLYPTDMPLFEKINTIATRIYRADEAIADSSVTWFFFFAAWSAFYLAALAQAQALGAQRRAAQAEAAARAGAGTPLAA